MIKVLLVDDHELVRTGIEALLNAAKDIVVIGVAKNGEQAILAIEDLIPDVILMDIKMPGIGGAEACRRILKNYPEIKIIGLSALNDGPVPKQLLDIGAMGFISKSSTSEEMINAVRQVYAGERYLCKDVLDNMLFQQSDEEQDSPFKKLSARESEVISLILQGKKIQDIAQILAISDKTVNTYRYRIYQKLNVKSDVDLTRLALKCNYRQF